MEWVSDGSDGSTWSAKLLRRRYNIIGYKYYLLQLLAITMLPTITNYVLGAEKLASRQSIVFIINGIM